MAQGEVIVAFPKTDFDFSGVGAGADEEMVMAKQIPVLAFATGQLVCRVHSVTITGGAQLDVLAKVTAPSRDDPSVDYVGSTAATAEIDGTSAGDLVIQGLGDHFGSFVQISVKATQGLGGGTIQATISADVVGTA